MTRLPIPGQDAGSWGQILNDYLAQSHNSDGTLKNNAVTASALAANAVNAQSLQAGTGINGHVLVLDSDAPGGFKWAANSGSSQVNTDWNATSGAAQILNKPALSAVATSGSYSDLTNTPTLATKLTDLTDVSASNPTNGQVLTYSQTSGAWVAGSAGNVTGIGITTIRKLTQAEYDALTTRDSATLYVISG